MLLPHDARAAHVERLAAAVVDGILVRVVALDADGAVLPPAVARPVPDVGLPAAVVVHGNLVELDLPGALLLAEHDQAALL